MARIIVIGGHGKVAPLLSPLLTARGDRVTSVFRNPDHGEEVAVAGATVRRPLPRRFTGPRRAIDSLAECPVGCDGYSAVLAGNTATVPAGRPPTVTTVLTVPT